MENRGPNRRLGGVVLAICVGVIVAELVGSVPLSVRLAVLVIALVLLAIAAPRRTGR